MYFWLFFIILTRMCSHEFIFLVFITFNIKEYNRFQRRLRLKIFKTSLKDSKTFIANDGNCTSCSTQCKLNGLFLILYGFFFGMTGSWSSHQKRVESLWQIILILSSLRSSNDILVIAVYCNQKRTNCVSIKRTISDEWSLMSVMIFIWSEVQPPWDLILSSNFDLYRDFTPEEIRVLRRKNMVTALGELDLVFRLLSIILQ